MTLLDCDKFERRKGIFEDEYTMAPCQYNRVFMLFEVLSDIPGILKEKNSVIQSKHIIRSVHLVQNPLNAFLYHHRSIVTNDTREVHTYAYIKYPFRNLDSSVTP